MIAMLGCLELDTEVSDAGMETVESNDCKGVQTRPFKLLPHYQSLQSRGEQDLEFWKEVATALVDDKHNTETSRNSYPITMFQEGPLHEPYFIAINNWGQVIIGPNKKTVATYVVGEFKVLI